MPFLDTGRHGTKLKRMLVNSASRMKDVHTSVYDTAAAITVTERQAMIKLNI